MGKGSTSSAEGSKSVATRWERHEPFETLVKCAELILIEPIQVSDPLPEQVPCGRKSRGHPRPSAIAGLVFAAGLLASVPASAQDYSARDVGGWTVAASKDGKGCFLTREYAETTLLLGLDTDDSNHVTVLNPNWSIRPKDRVELNFRLSNGSYPRHFAVGLASDGKRGFVTTFEARFLSRFAASQFLDVHRGEVPVEKLSLVGSGAAVAELRKCVDIFRAKPARGERGKERSGIPRDPFAPDAGSRSDE